MSGPLPGARTASPLGNARAVAPRAFLFDMDGLLVDTEPLWFEVERSFARTLGGEWTHELARDCVGRGLRNTVTTIRTTFAAKLDDAEGEGMLRRMFLERVGEIVLKPGAIELLDAAAGRVALALASSSPMELIEAILGAVGVADRFDTVVSGESVPRPKPAPDVFLRAALDVEVAPEACVVFEDSLPGVTAGRAAAMCVVAVPEAHPPPREIVALADMVARDLHEARALLRF